MSPRPPPIVFLGPSLPLPEARKILEADYRPPVCRGDFEDLPIAPTVLIVDGEFGQSLSVSPKEIHAFLQRGGRVLGASSMGALRALELQGLGMTGLGWIYEAYRSGRVIGDDEVALVYSPMDGRALSIPLINVRYWLEGLRDCGHVSRACAARLLASARAVHFTIRTAEALELALARVVGDARLRAWLIETSGFPDIKAEDCRTALRALAGESQSLRSQSRVAFATTP